MYGSGSPTLDQTHGAQFYVGNAYFGYSGYLDQNYCWFIGGQTYYLNLYSLGYMCTFETLT